MNLTTGAIIGAIAYIFFYRYEALSNLDQQWWRSAAMSLLDTGIFSYLVWGVMHYVHLMTYISDRLVRLKLTFSGPFLLALVALYQFELIRSDRILSGLAILMGSVLFVFGPPLCKAIVDAFPLRERDIALLLHKNPPRRHSDMIALHLFMASIAVMPIVLHKFLWSQVKLK